MDRDIRDSHLLYNHILTMSQNLHLNGVHRHYQYAPFTCDHCLKPGKPEDFAFSLLDVTFTKRYLFCKDCKDIPLHALLKHIKPTEKKDEKETDGGDRI